jgi:hypothetical protein
LIRKNRGFQNTQADDEADTDERDTDEKRDAPSPREKLILRQPRERGEHSGRGQQSGRHAHLRQAAVEATRACRRMLHGHQHRTAPLAANPKALREPQRHQTHRRPRPDLVVGRQQADGKRRQAHDCEGEHEHRLAADAVAVMPDDDAANRTRDETDRVRAERRQRPCQRIERRKVQTIEHERCGGAIEEEVVPLDRGADEAGERHEAN